MNIPKAAETETRNRASKRRVVTSCSECNRRKQRCDREWPCNRCLSRRVGHLCRYEGNQQGKKVHQKSSSAVQFLSHENEKEISPNSTKEVELTDENILTAIGSMEMTMGKLLLQEQCTGKCKPKVPTLDSRRSRNEVLKHFPKRKVVDFLIRFFLEEVNWIYEMVFAQTFTEEYKKWWLLSDYQKDHDFQFGILILRFCLNSIHCLPHLDYPTADIIDGSLDVIEKECDEAALLLDSYLPKPASLLRIRTLISYMIFLSNNGSTMDSVNTFSEAVEVAHSIGLFKEGLWGTLSEFEREERRKVFWFLYMWDRTACTYLGRWPLIPEEYIDINIPSETPYLPDTNSSYPTPMTDVIFHIKICQFLQSFISAPRMKTQRQNPEFVASLMKRFQVEIIDAIPSQYKLENPDTSWESTFPKLKFKRIGLAACVHGGIATLHRAFAGLTISGLPSSENEASKLNFSAAVASRNTLIRACIKAMEAIFELHELMGGGPQQYFYIPFCMIEYSTLVGMCTATDLIAMKDARNRPMMDGDLRNECIVAFQKAVELIELLAQRSPVAEKGVDMLRKLNNKIQAGQKQFLAMESLTPPNSVEAAEEATEGLSAPALEPNFDQFDLDFNTDPQILYNSEQDSDKFDQQNLMNGGWDFTVYDGNEDLGMGYSWYFDDNLVNGVQDTNALDFGDFT